MSSATMNLALNTALRSYRGLGPGRQYCVAGASTDFSADVYAASSESSTSLCKIFTLSGASAIRSFPNDSSVALKYTVTAGSLGSGKIWVQGPTSLGSAEVDLSTAGVAPTNGVDISGLTSPRQIVICGGPAGLRISVYVGDSSTGSFRLLQTIVGDADGKVVSLGSDQSSFMKYTVAAGTPTSATSVYVTGGEVPDFRARMVGTSIGANSVVGQILTVTATGALSAQDGVTPAVGDTVLFPGGLTNIATGDAGPWNILTLGDTTTSTTFGRPSWWQQGFTLPPTNTPIRIGASGTLNPLTTWRTTVGGGSTKIGTDDPGVYPDMVIQTVTLSTGAATITNVPIYSATKSSFRFERSAVGGTLTTTISYGTTAVTAGVLGTASVAIAAMIATGGTNTSDTSTGRFVITNFA